MDVSDDASEQTGLLGHHAGRKLRFLAALEFAVLDLCVKDIIMCGHSNCGAMQIFYENQQAGKDPKKNDNKQSIMARFEYYGGAVKDELISGGSSSEKAGTRLHRFGPNELAVKKRKTAFGILLDQFSDFMIFVFIAAALISGFIGGKPGMIMPWSWLLK